MRMYDVIKKKRDGEALSAEEIRAFIEGYSKGEIPEFILRSTYYGQKTIKSASKSPN